MRRVLFTVELSQFPVNLSNPVDLFRNIDFHMNPSFSSACAANPEWPPSPSHTSRLLLIAPDSIGNPVSLDAAV